MSILRRNSDSFPAATKNRPRSGTVDGRKEENVNKAGEIVLNILFYFFTYILVYFSILLPASLKAFVSETPVLLSHAKTIGFLLPDIIIVDSHFQFKIAFFVVVVYVPTIYSASLFSSKLVLPVIRLFKEPLRKHAELRANLGFSLIICMFLVAFGFTKFFEVSFKQLLLDTFFFVVFAIASATQGEIEQKAR